MGTKYFALAREIFRNIGGLHLCPFGMIRLGPGARDQHRKRTRKGLPGAIGVRRAVFGMLMLSFPTLYTLARSDLVGKARRGDQEGSSSKEAG
jgi:hypothetical protein